MSLQQTLDAFKATFEAGGPPYHDAFRAEFTGEILTPDSARYDQFRSVWNGAIDRKPAVSRVSPLRRLPQLLTSGTSMPSAVARSIW